MILTLTDARGVELDKAAEDRIEPVAGNDLQISLDVNIQLYAQQLAYQVMEQKMRKSFCDRDGSPERRASCNGQCAGI